MKNKIFLLWFAILCLLFWDSDSAFSCKCAPFPLANRLNSTDAIFSGKTVKVKFLDSPKQNSPEPRIIVTFDVYRFWKGPVGKRFILYTVANKWSCDGFGFREGSEYLVFAYNYTQESKIDRLIKFDFSAFGKDIFGTSLCNGTKLLSDAQEELKELGPGQTPK